MTTRIVRVVAEVSVTIDEDKFDDNFLEEFSSNFYDFSSVEEHVEHLAQLHARGLCDNHDFIEGYGNADEMGISFNSLDIVDMEII